MKSARVAALLWFLYASVALPAAFSAVDTPAAMKPPNPIDLPTALQLAGAQNLDIALAKEKLTEAKASQESAKWQFMPWVAPGISYRRHDNLIQDVAGNIVNVHKEAFTYGPTLTAQLDLGDAIYKNLAAKQLVKAAQFELEGQRQESILAAAQGYFDLAKAQAAAVVAQEAVRIAESYSAQVSQAVELGLAFKGDALRAQVQADHNRLLLRQAQEQQQTAAVRLALTLHLDGSLPLLARDAELLPVEIIPNSTSREELLAQALANRPEIDKHKHLVEAARESRKAAKYGPLFPSVGGQIFFGGLNGGKGGTSYSGGKSEDYQLTIGWRIGPGGLFDRGRLGVAESHLRSADIAQQKIYDEMARQVSESYARTQSLADQLTTSRRAVQSAEELLRLTEQRKSFAIGAVLENVQAEQELTRARLEYLNTISDFNKSEYALQRAIGGLAPANPASPLSAKSK
jgi:outer membrane protein TolC